MNTNLNSTTRLTDALERELLARAIEEQHEYHPDKALKALFTKAVSYFKGPKVTIHHATHAAH